MKMMIYGSRVCQISVSENFAYNSQVSCEYEMYTIAYAVEKFFSKSDRYRERCTWQSWKLRFAKGKDKKTRAFTFIVPAVLMELPGRCVRVKGSIDCMGVNVESVEILCEYPLGEENLKMNIAYQ